MLVKLPSPRHTIETAGNSLRITLPAQRNLLRLIWYGIALLFWAFITFQIVVVWITILGGATGIAGNASNSVGSQGALVVAGVILPVPLGLLALFGAILLYAFLWQITGKEIIEVNSQSITLSRQLFSWKRSRKYLAEGIRDLRIFQQRWEFAPVASIKKLLGGNGTIAFDYRAKTFRFGLEVEEAEAKEIISALQQNLPQSRRT